MAWIELHDNLKEHRKTYALCDALKIRKAEAVGTLTCFWTWCNVYAQDGELTGVPARAIASACEWEKKPDVLLEALISCGWIDRSADGSLHVHDWFDYAGRLIESRAKNAGRMREARAKNVKRTCDARSGATVPNPTEPISTSSTTARACDMKDPGFASVVNTFRENIHDPTPAEREILVDIYPLAEPDVIVAVIKASVAAGSGKGNARYIETVVRSLADSKITTLVAYRAHERERNDAKRRHSSDPRDRAPPIDALSAKAQQPFKPPKWMEDSENAG